MLIQIEDPRREDVAALLREHLKSMHEISPPESVHALDLEELRATDITFWVARNEGKLLGCGALKSLGGDHGEIKSMRTTLENRRQGTGRRLLQHIIDEAQVRQITRLYLETGSMAEFTPARTLYESFGFTYCGPFGGYVADPNSVFMSLHIQR